MLGLVDLADVFTGNIVKDLINAASIATNIASTFMGGIGAGLQKNYKDTEWTSLPTAIKIAFSVPGFLMYMSQGGQEMIELLYNLMTPRDHSIKHNSHGLYDKYERLNNSTLFRNPVLDSNYIGSSFQNFGDTGDFKINNLFRPDTVAVQIKDFIDEPFYNLSSNNIEDESRYTLGEKAATITDPNLLKSFFNDFSSSFETPICTLYGALKFDFDNQYGQLEGIKQVPMKGCTEFINDRNPDNFYIVLLLFFLVMFM